MPLDSQVKALLEQIEQFGMPKLAEMTPAEARALFEQSRELGGPPEPVARVEDRTIPGPGGSLKARVYTPFGEPPFPVMVFFHGGGWVLGDLESHDSLARLLTNASGSVVVAIDYRLAPESKYPAAVDDAYAATRWVADHAADLGGDATRLGVGGDSAGGNLSAVVSLLARDRGGPVLAFQLLIYPATDFAMNLPSIRENAEGYFLTHEDMIWFANHYVPEAADRLDPIASPLLAADHSGLPPAIVVIAHFDPLRDEGVAYGEKLRKAGVPVKVRHYDDMIHGFLSFAGVVDAGRQAARDVGADVRDIVTAKATRLG